MLNKNVFIIMFCSCYLLAITNYDSHKGSFVINVSQCIVHEDQKRNLVLKPIKYSRVGLGRVGFKMAMLKFLVRNKIINN